MRRGRKYTVHLDIVAFLMLGNLAIAERATDGR